MHRRRGPDKLRQALVAYGAPLAGVSPKEVLPLEDALLAGLAAAHQDATLLRVLPVVLAKNTHRINWVNLKDRARRRRLKAELGFVTELTSKLAGRPELAAKVQDLLDRRRRVKMFFHEPRSDFERHLAKKNSPRLAKKWGFFLNMGEDAFLSTLRRHVEAL